MQFNPGCLCCPEADCCGCAAVPTSWTYPLALTSEDLGLSPFCCGNCDDFDNTYTLSPTESQCRWYNYESPSTACSGSGVDAGGNTCYVDPFVQSELYCDGTNWLLFITLVVRITTTGGFGGSDTFYVITQARYSKSAASWNCLAANTMAKDYSTGSPSTVWPSGICFNGMPATITVTPV